MLQLLDGPCKGTFMAKSAPLFLRAVLTNKLFAENDPDVLDQPEDTPAANEKVYVYERQGKAGWFHLKGDKNVTGFYATGQYKHRPDIEGERFRDNQRWHAWLAERATFASGIEQTERLSSGGTKWRELIPAKKLKTSYTPRPNSW
jgi:hypothetical protein